MLLIRYKHSRQQADIDAAISRLSEAAKATPAGHPNRSAFLSNLGVALRDRYELAGQQADLDLAITTGEQAVDATPAGHPRRPGYLTNLGNALQARSGLTGQRADLDRAVTLFSEVADTAPADHPDRPKYLYNLGHALCARSELTGEQADLDRALTLLSAAADTFPVGHPDRARLLSSLGAVLSARFHRTGRQADLDLAVTIGTQTVDATPPGHPDRPMSLSNLAIAVYDRYRRTGQDEDLDLAITLGEQAVDGTPAADFERFRRLSSLGNALRAQYERSGRAEDLDQAIIRLSEAADATPADHPDRPAMVSNLAFALWARYERTGQEAELGQAITLFSEAADATPVGHWRRPTTLSNLGNVLRSRYWRTGQQADLDEAITLGWQAVGAAPAGNPDRPGFLCNLGLALRNRYERTGCQADLDRAVAVLQEAVDASPSGHTNRHMYLSNLGGSLQLRHQHAGQIADLDQAISVGQQAVDATPAAHPDRPTMLSNLGAALWARYEVGGQQADLDHAIARFSQALDATQADHPNRTALLTNLGNALQARYDRTGQQADLSDAAAAHRAGARAATGPPALRVAAAQKWAQYALLAGDSEGALEGFTVAIELLPLVAWHGLDQATREHHLRESAGLAPDAAAVAIAAGNPVRAVELLEAGRSMLWTQALHLRQDLAALQQRAPDLTVALEASRAVLNKPSTKVPGAPSPFSDAGQAQAAERQMLEERRQAAHNWDTAINRIRTFAGFEHFLRPAPFTALRAAADEGPVAIVNISQHSSHALIVSPASGADSEPAVRIVELPAATMRTVIDRANDLLSAQHTASDSTADWPAKEADRHAVFDMLAWCWHAIAEPILTALGHTNTPPGKIEDWPRLWWCPTGPATVLPLHAAGRHPRTGAQYQGMGEATALTDSVAGRVISSYTPTLSTLARARTRAAPDRVLQLAVGMAEPPSYISGGSPLPAVTAEFQALARHLHVPEHATHLLDLTANRQAVLEGVRGHSWLHVSCHGSQHPDDASLSAFFLHDRPLTIADLAALDLQESDLAYLAACQTATGDLRLLDEALHLAAALQLVGYRHVLATLWSISDAAAPAMADIMYAHLLHPDPDHPSPTDRPQAARAPYALHHAATRLRQAWPSEPLLWAPYIHIGP